VLEGRLRGRLKEQQTTINKRLAWAKDQVCGGKEHQQGGTDCR
jgi:hypothetical protein